MDWLRKFRFAESTKRKLRAEISREYATRFEHAWNEAHEMLAATVPEGERVEEYNRGYRQAVDDLFKIDREAGLGGYIAVQVAGRDLATVETTPGGFSRIGFVNRSA